MPATYAGAIDSVGGATLASVVARLQPGAAVAASGNTGGAQLETTVLPFILRGVSLLGIDSVTTPIARRREIWERLARDIQSRGLDAIRRPVALSDVESALDEITAGGVTGRYVVDTTQ
jgi:NADPH:quinone reductase-like Zn-dependent oxidoreductase